MMITYITQKLLIIFPRKEEKIILLPQKRASLVRRLSIFHSNLPIKIQIISVDSLIELLYI
jgi:hypothetical protein